MIPPRIIAVDEDIARLSGLLRATSEQKGHQVTQADMLIAATAIRNGLTLATRNVDDFRTCGLAIMNPFLFSSGF